MTSLNAFAEAINTIESFAIQKKDEALIALVDKLDAVYADYEDRVKP